MQFCENQLKEYVSLREQKEFLQAKKESIQTSLNKEIQKQQQIKHKHKHYKRVKRGTIKTKRRDNKASKPKQNYLRHRRFRSF